MLHAMEQTTETRTPGDRSSSQVWESAPSSASTSFAGLLAALTEPAQPTGVPGDGSLATKQSPAHFWNDDDLADDVAILSYESALKSHARYRSTDQSLTQSANLEPYCYEEASSGLPVAAQKPVAQYTASLGAIPSPEPRATPAPDPNSEPSLYRAAAFDRNLKDASITIRMSKAECAQLHRRAAEAGLTVSAYLRSCTFEAESLRAMVKDTLARLRSVTTQAKPAPSASHRFGRITRWLTRLITPWHNSQRVARA
jgi:hypothetical protein